MNNHLEVSCHLFLCFVVLHFPALTGLCFWLFVPVSTLVLLHAHAHSLLGTCHFWGGACCSVAASSLSHAGSAFRVHSPQFNFILLLHFLQLSGFCMVFLFSFQAAIIFCGVFFSVWGFIFRFCSYKIASFSTLLMNYRLPFITLWRNMHGDFSIEKVEAINMEISLLALQSLIALYIMEILRL